MPFPSPRDLSNPGVEPVSPALAGGFFTTVPPGKPVSRGQSTWKPGCGQVTQINTKSSIFIIPYLSLYVSIYKALWDGLKKTIGQKSNTGDLGSGGQALDTL